MYHYVFIFKRKLRVCIDLHLHSGRLLQLYLLTQQAAPSPTATKSANLGSILDSSLSLSTSNQCQTCFYLLISFKSISFLSQLISFANLQQLWTGHVTSLLEITAFHFQYDQAHTKLTKPLGSGPCHSFRPNPPQTSIIYLRLLFENFSDSFECMLSLAVSLTESAAPVPHLSWPIPTLFIWMISFRCQQQSLLQQGFLNQSSRLDWTSGDSCYKPLKIWLWENSFHEDSTNFYLVPLNIHTSSQRIQRWWIHEIRHPPSWPES